MAIQFYDREVAQLTNRFKKVLGGGNAPDFLSREAVVLAICRAGMLARAIKKPPPEEPLEDLVEEFSQIRQVLNRMFDLTETKANP
ncbi:MAG: hypothetical protein AB2L22_13140 [Syntrophales bacterium]